MSQTTDDKFRDWFRDWAERKLFPIDRPPDWRNAKPAWQPPSDRVTLRNRLAQILRGAGQWALSQIHPDPRERRKIYIYLTIMTWLVMISIGLLAAHGVHP